MAAVPEAIALAGDVDDCGVLQEPIQNGGGGRHVADQLGPVLQRTIAGHHRRTILVPAHDDLQQAFAAAPGKLFHSHVVDNEQVGVKIPGQRLVLGAQILVAQKVAGQVEDGSVQNHEAALDGLVSDGLNQK